MTEEQTQVNEETKSPEITPEQQNIELRRLAEMKHKMFSSLLGIHIDTLSSIMLNGNGVSYKKKLEAAKALREAILFSLDFGLDISKAKIRQGGQTLSKESNNLAGVMVQALDNRMLLIADNLNKMEQENLNKTEETGEKTNE